MTIEFKEGRYFAKMWFLEGGNKDWLAAVYRDGPEDVWHLLYRFRYYNSADPWDETDKKNWYSATMPVGTSEEDIVGKVDFLGQSMECMGFGGKLNVLVLQSDDPKFIGEQLSKQVWAHSRVETRKPEEKAHAEG